MLHKSLFNLSLLILFLHPVAHAESIGNPGEGNTLEILQAQLRDANEKITVLETVMNTTNQDINELRNCEVFKRNPCSQSDAGERRTANGHGK